MIFLLETQNTFEFLMTVCRGLGGNRIVHDDERKSLGHETYKFELFINILTLFLNYYIQIRTFSSKISGNKEEILKIIYELSEDVSNELIKDELMVVLISKIVAYIKFTKKDFLNKGSKGQYQNKNS